MFHSRHHSLIKNIYSPYKGMKLTFLFKPNLFLSKRTKALVVISITVLLQLFITLGLVLEIVFTGVTVNPFRLDALCGYPH